MKKQLTLAQTTPDFGRQHIYYEWMILIYLQGIYQYPLINMIAQAGIEWAPITAKKARLRLK